MADELALMGALLGLRAPWQVAECRLSADGKRMDVWIVAARGKSWFGRGQRAVPDEALLTWRHSALCGVPCYVHVPAALQASLGEAPWAGEAGIPFSRAVTREIIALLAEGVKFQTICVLLALPFADLWKYKFAFERGLAGGGAAASPPAEDAGGLPDPGDPVWERLLNGDFEIDVHALSLKLLITRLRAQMRLISDPDVRDLKIRELQRYFSRHESLLGREIAQIGQQIRQGTQHV